MTKGRQTTTIGLRLPDDFLEQLEPKAKAKGLSVTAYLKDFVLREALRKHRRNDVRTIIRKAFPDKDILLEQGLADAAKGKVSKIDLDNL